MDPLTDDQVRTTARVVAAARARRAPTPDPDVADPAHDPAEVEPSDLDRDTP